MTAARRPSERRLTPVLMPSSDAKRVIGDWLTFTTTIDLIRRLRCGPRPRHPD